VKLIEPWLFAESIAASKFCDAPEEFIRPAPLIVRLTKGGTVIEKALAPELKAIAFTSTPAESESAVWLLNPKKAVSAAPFGTVRGTQFFA
jgi:hypothetical protein